jgi:hypothetical protein
MLDIGGEPLTLLAALPLDRLDAYPLYMFIPFIGGDDDKGTCTE